MIPALEVLPFQSPQASLDVVLTMGTLGFVLPAAGVRQWLRVPTGPIGLGAVFHDNEKLDVVIFFVVVRFVVLDGME